MINVSVIIPVYHDKKGLEECLVALAHQSYPIENFEIIVVNNDPDDSIENIIKRFPQFKFLSEPKPGSYCARNKGLEEAQGHIIAFTDSDCIPDVDWLKSAANIFSSDYSIDRLAGHIEVYMSRDPDSGELYESIFAFDQEKHVKSGLSVTANFFTKKSVLESVGNFNENLLSGGDFEWNNRASHMGYSIEYAKEVVVLHPARQLKSILSKARRVYGKRYEEEKARYGKVAFTFLGIYYLRPPLSEIVATFKQKKHSRIMQKIGIAKVAILKRVAQCFEHYRLMMGWKKLRS